MTDEHTPLPEAADAGPQPAPEAEAAPPEKQATAPVPAPASEAPPRIIAEAPLGGVPRPVSVPAVPGIPRVPTLPDRGSEGETLKLNALPPDDPALSQYPTVPDGVYGQQALAEREGWGALEHAQPPAEAAAASAPQEPEQVPAAGEVAPASAPEDAAPAPALPPEPAAEAPIAVHSSAPEEVIAAAGDADLAADWDEELSPELARVLFGGKTAPAASPAQEQVTPEAAPAPPLRTLPAAQATPVTEPAAAIQLTDIAQVRHLPITAQGHRAAPPETTLQGRARYVRIEEPLRGGAGQRIRETWDYLKPDYPALGGRLVRRVQIEELQHADGSWQWRYERRYGDRGRDTRTVRANADRTLIVRADEVSALAADSGRRVRYREEVALIFAPPARSAPRGLLARLFKRGGSEAVSGPRVWRVASRTEVQQARRQGGAAL